MIATKSDARTMTALKKKIGENNIATAASARNIGVTVNSMETQIQSTCKSAYIHVHIRTQCTGTHHSSAERASLVASSSGDKVQSPHTGVQGKKQLGARVPRGAVDGAQTKQGSALRISRSVEGTVHKICTRPKQNIQCQRPTALE